jgi:hypothetical protein
MYETSKHRYVQEKKRTLEYFIDTLSMVLTNTLGSTGSLIGSVAELDITERQRKRGLLRQTHRGNERETEVNLDLNLIGIGLFFDSYNAGLAKVVR